LPYKKLSSKKRYDNVPYRLEYIHSTVKSIFKVRGMMSLMKNENREAGFGKRLAELRKQRGLTQQQLCELVGVHVSMLANYESNRSQPTLEVIRKMALALDVTADELVFDKAERQPQMLDKELLKNREKIDGLPDDDKLAVKKIVAALLVKHSVELAVR